LLVCWLSLGAEVNVVSGLEALKSDTPSEPGCVVACDNPSRPFLDLLKLVNVSMEVWITDDQTVFQGEEYQRLEFCFATRFRAVFQVPSGFTNINYNKPVTSDILD
jgi:hypothetical protein